MIMPIHELLHDAAQRLLHELDSVLDSSRVFMYSFTGLLLDWTGAEC